MTTIGEQPTFLLSFNTTYSTLVTLEVANNSWHAYHLAIAI
jgi:hypothetical protein